MEKLLYLASHLSTGGMPQYLAKKVELMVKHYDVYVVEYEDITGGVLVVQKNIIKDLIHDNLISIPYGGDKNEIISIIDSIKPDIIHFTEMPEYFMEYNIAKQIYKNDRSYKIFETCHDSSFNPTNKRFFPDKFILVSQYQVEMLQSLKIPSEVVEYPIEYNKRPDRNEMLMKLGLDPEYKHVLHVGLFTPRKNQSEFFEYAKKFLGSKIIFHSVGALADNFKDYWEPLLSNKPENLIVHGQKSNTADFYAAMDLFLFTSKGTVHDKETMPLVIKEAISWDLPTLIYNLPVYQNYFDDYNLVQYLNFDSFDDNVKLINDMLYNVTVSETVNPETKPVIIISTYPNNKNIINLTENCIREIKKYGYDVILTSHYAITEPLQNMVDYAIYDSNNILTYNSYYSKSYYRGTEFYADININQENNNIYHGSAVYTNYYNGIKLANQLGYVNAICVNFDVLLKNQTALLRAEQSLSKSKGFFNYVNVLEGDTLNTFFMGINCELFLSTFPLIKTEEEYNAWWERIGSESNGLENLFYFTLKDKLNELTIVGKDEFYNLFEGSQIELCSQTQYFTVLPIKDKTDGFILCVNLPNRVDDRVVSVTVTEFDGDDMITLYTIPIEVKNRDFFYQEFGFNYDIDHRYYFDLYENENTHKKSIQVNKDYMSNKINLNGIFIKS